MKKKNPKAKQQHLIRQEGQYAGSRKRWWLVKQVEPSCDEAIALQRYQFDPKMGGRPRFDEAPPSPRAYAEQYGDSSLDYHVEKLLRGVHELCLKNGSQ